MKILILTWEFPPRIVGGVARHCFGLTQALAKSGHEVNVVTLEFPGAPAFEEIGKVKVYRVSIELGHPNFLTWVLLFNHFMEKKGSLLCREDKPDVIHAHDWLASPSAIALKHSINIPLVFTVHSTEKGRAQGLHNPDSFTIDGFEWWATYEASKVIVTTNAMKSEVGGFFNLPVEKIATIPNAINKKKFENVRDLALQKHRMPHEKTILFVGRLTPQKGIEYLIRAVPLILKNHPDGKVIIVGEGWLRDSLERLASSIDKSERILFTGFLSEYELRNIMVSSDVLVLPSIYEPFGIVALEGMAAGIPVVASRIDGLAEIISHDENGVLVYPKNPESIAWGVSRVLSNQNYAENLVRNAKKKLLETYNWDVIAEKTSRVYEEAIKL